MNPIREYHAHVYFDPDERQRAVHLREEVGRRFAVTLGRVHDRPVGPHAKSMFQVLIGREKFAAVVSWLMLNRRGLDVLVHPDTGDDLADHTRHAMWLGERLPLDVSAFEPALTARSR